MNSLSKHIATESFLIQACVSKNRRMQELLYNLYAEKMYGICIRYSKNEEDAKDMLQEGFMKVFKYLHNYRFDGSFDGWIRKIFINTALAGFKHSVFGLPISEAHEASVDNKNWDVLDAFNVQDIIKLLHQLSPGYRQVFNLYVIEGYTHKEIAAMLAIDEGTSKSQLARAKKALRELINKSRLSFSN